MMLSEGLLNKQIAYELNVSEATVKAHVSAILQKLGVESRTQAIAAAKIGSASGRGGPAALMHSLSLRAPGPLRRAVVPLPSRRPGACARFAGAEIGSAALGKRAPTMRRIG